MARLAKYHTLGRALKRIMAAENVQAASQREFAEIINDSGYVIDQRLLSAYMRLSEKEVDGKTVLLPHAYAPMEFIAAVILILDLNSDQINDLVLSWLDILPERKRIAVLALADTLYKADISVEAWRETLVLEQEREAKVAVGNNNGSEATGSRAP